MRRLSLSPIGTPGAWLRLMRVDRPVGYWLLLWPTWIGLFAAPGRFSWRHFALFTLGVFVMRSAGCVINDYADRNIDGHVERTRARPLAAGEVRPHEALALFAVLGLAAFALVLLMNRLTIELAFVAIALAAIYPFMKRITNLPQLFLGTAFAWSIPMAFAAVGESLPGVCWVLFAATICWVIAYDTMYAMVDRDDDLKIGVKSTAILFGQQDRLIIGLLQLAMFLLLIWAGMLAGLGYVYFIGLALAALLAGYQQWLIRKRERDGCFRAFLNNHPLGLVVFLGLFFDYVLI